MQSLAPPLSKGPVELEAVITTAELGRRVSRPADYAAENAVLHKLASAMAQTPRSLLQELVDSARELCGAGSAGISVLDPDSKGSVFRWIATSGRYAQYQGNTLPRHFSPCGSVLRANRMLMMSDPIRHFPYIDELNEPAREVLLVPFYRGEEAIGTVWVVHHTERQFDSEDARLVTSLSKYAAAAVQFLESAATQRSLELDARLAAEQALARLEEELKDTRRLRDVAARMIGENDSATLFDDILSAALEITGADAGTIQLLDPASNTLGFLATSGFPSSMTDHFARVDASSQSPCGIALAEGARVFIHFDPDAPTGSSDRLHVEQGLSCAQSTPLLSRSGRPLGMFSTHWRAARTLREREIRFLELLGRQAADLIERTQAQNELREADRRKDEFIAILAHELRNPLVPIRTGVELLNRAHEQPGIVERIQPMMQRQVAHMVRLIDDLLDVSRITSGKIELRRQRVSIASVIDTAVEANRSAIMGAQLALVMNVTVPDRLIEVDPTRFSQVIANILHNATKFTPTGGRITLDAVVESGCAGQELVLRISDTGVGIASDSLRSIFGLFTQGPPACDGRVGGLGIGLAISQKLVELHGGSIQAESAGPGLGCRFTVRLAAPELSGADHTQRGVTATCQRRLRVLVVDDNQDAADSIGLLVAQLGAESRVVYGGVDALNALQSFDAALVLLDIGMPELDGYEVCRRIRELRGRDVAVVAVTGWGQREDRRRAIDAGFDAHLTKPVDPDVIVKLIAANAEERAAVLGAYA